MTEVSISKLPENLLDVVDVGVAAAAAAVDLLQLLSTSELGERRRLSVKLCERLRGGSAGEEEAPLAAGGVAAAAKDTGPGLVNMV